MSNRLASDTPTGAGAPKAPRRRVDRTRRILTAAGAAAVACSFGVAVAPQASAADWGDARECNSSGIARHSGVIDMWNRPGTQNLVVYYEFCAVDWRVPMLPIPGGPEIRYAVSHVEVHGFPFLGIDIDAEDGTWRGRNSPVAELQIPVTLAPLGGPIKVSTSFTFTIDAFSRDIKLCDNTPTGICVTQAF